MDLEARIRVRAAELGFSACGFSAAVPLERGAFLAGWLDAGFAGDMHYLERRPDRRLTMAGVLADARTVITLAYPYDPPPPPRVDWRRELRGRIAAYALGEDYHRVLDRKLRAFETFLATAAPTSRTRRYVDTGAVLEREWAVRGGLGWFGKNTVLLGSGGSWFFLAELVTTVALTPDTPTGSHCGRCTRCLDACPTGALADGLVMDARRCIAYLTIEHRGSIPTALRPKLGPWIFGCDVCQEVCPWNEPVDASRPADLVGGARLDAASNSAERIVNDAEEPETAEWLTPGLPALLSLDEAAFRARYGKTPVARAKRRGFLRNVAVALGNSANPAAIAALVSALADAEPLVRGHAAWALGRLGGRVARRALDRQRRRENDATVAGELDAALAESPS